MSELVKYGTTKNDIQRFLDKETGLIIQEKKVRLSIMFKLFVVYMTLRGTTRHSIAISMGISPTSVYN